MYGPTESRRKDIWASRLEWPAQGATLQEGYRKPGPSRVGVVRGQPLLQGDLLRAAGQGDEVAAGVVVEAKRQAARKCVDGQRTFEPNIFGWAITREKVHPTASVSDLPRVRLSGGIVEQ